MGGLSQLIGVDLSENLLTGSIRNLSKVVFLDLSSNRLTGSIPNFSELWTLDLGNNLLSFTIPSALGSLSELTYLSLDHNYLTGQIPALGNLSKLGTLDLDSNLLTGSIPELGHLSELTWLDLNSNDLSGTIPALNSATKLKNLIINSNSITGTIPSFNTIALEFCLLHQNQLTGTLDHTAMQQASNLRILTVSRNRFSGVVPWEQLANANNTRLTTLALDHNEFTGSLPSTLPPNLMTLLLGDNDFSGRVPSFEPLTDLMHLTLQNNRFEAGEGGLILPPNNKLQTLLAQNNFLSCSIRGSPESHTIKDNLLAPGNRFGPWDSRPTWEATSSVQFLWQDTFWEEFEGPLIFGTAGLTAFMVMAIVLARQDILAFFWFSPEHHVEHMEFLAAKMLAYAFLLTLPLYVLYPLGANLYACYRTFLTLSIVNLGNAEVPEWSVAVWSCICASVMAFGLLIFRAMCLEHVNRAHTESPQEEVDKSMSWCQFLGVCAMWLVVILVFSGPSMLYAAAASVPKDNIYNISSFWLTAIPNLIGPINYTISAVVLPYIATKLVQDSQSVVKFIIFSRFTIIVVVPMVVAGWMSQECGAGWVKTWKRCADDSTSFEVIVNARSWYDVPMPLPVSSHADVCGLSHKIKLGKCSRAVLDIVGTLVTRKILWGTFTVPAFTLARYQPALMRWLEGLVQCFRPTYIYKKDLIIEVTSVVQYAEYALLFGVAFPIIVPLTGIAVVKNLLVIHHVLHTHQYPILNYVAFSSHTLWLCLGLGVAWVMCIYISNDLHGRLLVAIGMPVGALLGCALGLWFCRSKQLGRVRESTVAMRLGGVDTALSDPLLIEP